MSIHYFHLFRGNRCKQSVKFCVRSCPPNSGQYWGMHDLQPAIQSRCPRSGRSAPQSLQGLLKESWDVTTNHSWPDLDRYLFHDVTNLVWDLRTIRLPTFAFRVYMVAFLLFLFYIRRPINTLLFLSTNSHLLINHRNTLLHHCSNTLQILFRLHSWPFGNSLT